MDRRCALKLSGMALIGAAGLPSFAEGGSKDDGAIVINGGQPWQGRARIAEMASGFLPTSGTMRAAAVVHRKAWLSHRRGECADRCTAFRMPDTCELVRHSRVYTARVGPTLLSRASRVH
jgi:hypothetical protein